MMKCTTTVLFLLRTERTSNLISGKLYAFLSLSWQLLSLRHCLAPDSGCEHAGGGVSCASWRAKNAVSLLTEIKRNSNNAPKVAALEHQPVMAGAGVAQQDIAVDHVARW